MKFKDYRTGMIVRENNDYFLVLGLFDYVVEETKRQIANYDINIISKSLEWVLYDVNISMLELKTDTVDFTKKMDDYDIFPITFAYLTHEAVLVKTLKIPEEWMLKNKLLYPSLRGLMPAGEGIKEIEKAFNANKYRALATRIKKQSVYKKVKKVRYNQVVAVKVEHEYRVFLVEENRVLEFIKTGLSNRITDIKNFDLAKYQRVRSNLYNAKEYYLLGELKC